MYAARADVSDSPDDRRERDPACAVGKRHGVAPAPAPSLWEGRTRGLAAACATNATTRWRDEKDPAWLRAGPAWEETQSRGTGLQCKRCKRHALG